MGLQSEFVAQGPVIEEEDVNWFPVCEQLAAIAQALDGGAVKDAASSLREISLQWSQANIQFSDAHVAQNIGVFTRLCAELAEDGQAETAALRVRTYQASLAATLPDFRIVLRDETRDWADEALVEKAGSIWGAYLYDANRAVCLAELTPSYELHYLYTTAQNELPDDMQEILQQHGAPEDGAIYMHCRGVDAIPWSHKHVCGVPNDTGVDTYRELVDAQIEHYKCNYAIDTPRPVDLGLAARFALELASHARDNSNEVHDLLDCMPPAAKQEIAAYQAQGTLSSALEMYLQALDARREFASAVAQEKILLEGAQLAARFHREVLDTFETVSAIGEQFGNRAMADLFYLQGAIMSGASIDVWPQSGIFDVIDQLPSARAWASFTKPCNRYGEPAPRRDVTDVEPTMR